MNRIVCDHLVPEDQRCLGCDAEAAKWHPDTKRILELEAHLKAVLDAIPAIRRAHDPTRLKVIREARKLLN